ncbi:MAG: NAD-dependent succinate-semialdehyde dehydrogenase [Proteobacteria bacterium]|nr:NAD-dependent succinate-semialdehyde dehydrogenase [Pseudomonadota bacterium]
MAIESINPATGERVEVYEEHTFEQAREAIEAADRAFRGWRETDFGQRAERMRRAAELLRERKRDYARLMCDEMGKLLRDGEAEAEKCAWVCEYYAENARAFLAHEPIETDASKSFVCFEPLGAVLAVMPWNFPFWQVFRFAAPALMAGNVGVLKHASNVPGCALEIERVFRDAGFPADAFRSLLVRGSEMERVIAHPKLRAVTLTGSTPAGRAVARQAGERLKKTVLELGGSDAYVILEDADLEAAARACVDSRLINAGQSCIAAKRFVVPAAVRAEFERLYVAEMRRRRLGDPTDPDSDLGPQAREDLRDELHGQVERSVAAGARCLLGGEVPERAGAWYPPTVLTDVAPGMPAYDDELFGPVAAIIPVADEDEAIRVANDSPFGLGAAVFTRDRARGEEIAARRLEAGCCFVNAFVKSDPRLPFGGVKESGYGRELGPYGIKEFVNVKTVYVQ